MAVLWLASVIDSFDRCDPVATQPKVRPLTPEREAELRKLLGLESSGFEDELAQVLRCSTRTVQRLEFPFIVVGAKRLYDLRRAPERLRQVARIETPGPEDAAEGDLPPAVRHRRRLERESADTD